MRLIATEIPDDPADLPGWLERQLVGLDLARLVAELEAVHGAAASSGPTLDQVLGGRRAGVLAHGLTDLPADRLPLLLRQPRLLLDLQEQILIEGGSYWDRLGPRDTEHLRLIERGRKRLAQFVSAEPVLPFRRRRATYLNPWLLALATAASVLVGVVGFEWVVSRPDAGTAAGWGWSRPGALPQGGTPAAYLNRLADAAEDWFQKRPADAAGVARRIGEFRRGCTTLVHAEHRPLAPADRAWLVGKCQAWAAQLDAHLASLERGEDPVKVRSEADETVHKLIAALRERAASASS
jgi:hypothetical protein